MSWIAGLFLQIIEWFWGKRQQSQGEAQGKAEEDAAGLRQALEDAEKAEKARGSADVAGTDGVRGDLENLGPADRP